MSLNKVMLIGNVGRDPNVRYLEGNNPGNQGRKVATFTLATSERYRDRNGETRENTMPTSSPFVNGFASQT